MISEIPLREKPSHGSVKRVQRITEDWTLMKIGLPGIRKYLDSKKKTKAENTEEEKTDTYLKSFLMDENPDLLFELISLQESEGEYQTIMLPTGWNLQKMMAFEEEASEEDYQVLLRRCIEIMGGTAADFFGTSRTGSSSRPVENQPGEIPKT
ncbi:hypothetical protein [Methanosarcina sp.]|uniref:hypothetical protein n=1 Tax=Methanosarcina sp. TaxID=2213 RepID=UPI003BB52984